MAKDMWENAALWLLVIGGLNWGLVGLAKYNLVEAFVPANFVPWVYGAVGVSSVFVAWKMWQGKL